MREDDPYRYLPSLSQRILPLARQPDRVIRRPWAFLFDWPRLVDFFSLLIRGFFLFLECSPLREYFFPFVPRSRTESGEYYWLLRSHPPRVFLSFLPWHATFLPPLEKFWVFVNPFLFTSVFHKMSFATSAPPADQMQF